MTKLTAVYVRVSGRKQDEASQLPDLERWIAGNLDVLREDTRVEWYRDKFTGKTMDRPGMNRLQRDIESGCVQTVVCWRIDRLGRTARGLAVLFDDLVKRRINLVSLKDGLDLSTPAGRLMAGVISSVSAYETEIRAEHVLAGQAVARANGKTWGGGVKGRRVKVTPEQESVVRRLKSEGSKVAAIARATGLSRPTVYDILKSEVVS